MNRTVSPSVSVLDWMGSIFFIVTIVPAGTDTVSEVNFLFPRRLVRNAWTRPERDPVAALPSRPSSNSETRLTSGSSVILPEYCHCIILTAAKSDKSEPEFPYTSVYKESVRLWTLPESPACPFNVLSSARIRSLSDPLCGAPYTVVSTFSAFSRIV